MASRQLTRMIGTVTRTDRRRGGTMTTTAESTHPGILAGGEGRSADPSVTILTCADPGWDKARQAWNLAVDQHPAAVALPKSAAEAAAAVRFARDRGLRIAAQGTGHNAAPLGDLADTVLIKTHAMRGVSIDPAARVARAQAGAVWQEVADAAGKHGLAGLAGSSPDVGVVGYTLGGGMSWLGRTYGLAASNVEAFNLVTADGAVVRADAASEPDLFWALRGGGGSFAVVTAVELRLFPVTEVYAGLLWYPIERASEVLHAWRDLTRSGLPDAFTTTARLINCPPIPEIPEQIRGRSFAVLDVIHLGGPAEADALLAPLRALGPVMDTIGTVPAPALGRVHMDPEEPFPAKADGLLLASLPAQAIDQLINVAGPGSGSRLLGVELRHLGGEFARPRPGNGALAVIDADYALLAAGIAPTPEAARAAAAGIEAVTSALAPWAAPQMYLNFAETSRDPASFWSPHTYDRLRCIKAAVDPHNLIRANHPIPPAGH
jgi:FAD binding domain/Berberine and berberine like